MLRQITTAANANCDLRRPTAKSQADSDPNGVPICSPPFDPSLAPPHDGEAMHIRPFTLFYTGNLSFCRVEQIPAQSRLSRAYCKIPKQHSTPPVTTLDARW
jgi:hypothetical protein